MGLALVPVFRDTALAFLAAHHRHHGRPQGYLFAIGVAAEGGLVGVAMVSRPVAHRLQDGETAEVIRLCTDGTHNACSFLYGAAWRAARALGYRRLITYTLPEEGGASLRGAGWRCVGETRGGSWSRESRPRVDRAPTCRKLRWEAA